MSSSETARAARPRDAEGDPQSKQLGGELGRINRRPIRPSQDPWALLAYWWGRRPAKGKAALACDVAASSRQWIAALHTIDRGGRLSQREVNQLLDTIALAIDAEREIAARALERGLMQANKRSGQ
jgi:hypothetical protein